MRTTAAATRKAREMANDLYLYNGTNLNYDTTASLGDIIGGLNRIVPPGAQTHIVFQSPGELAAAVAQHERYAVKDYTTLTNPSTTPVANVAHHTAPMVVNGKVPKLV